MYLSVRLSICLSACLSAVRFDCQKSQFIEPVAIFFQSLEFFVGMLLFFVVVVFLGGGVFLLLFCFVFCFKISFSTATIMLFSKVTCDPFSLRGMLTKKTTTCFSESSLYGFANCLLPQEDSSRPGTNVALLSFIDRWGDKGKGENCTQSCDDRQAEIVTRTQPLDAG